MKRGFGRLCWREKSTKSNFCRIGSVVSEEGGGGGGGGITVSLMSGGGGGGCVAPVNVNAAGADVRLRSKLNVGAGIGEGDKHSMVGSEFGTSKTAAKSCC